MVSHLLETWITVQVNPNSYGFRTISINRRSSCMRGRMWQHNVRRAGRVIRTTQPNVWRCDTSSRDREPDSRYGQTMCVKRTARGAVAISRTLAIENVVIAWRVRHAYRQGFESRERTATDIFGARRVSTNTRRNAEIRPYVSASEIAALEAHQAHMTINTNVAKHFAWRAKRTERQDISVILQPLKIVLSPSDRVLYVFYDFENDAEYPVLIQLQCTFRFWYAYSSCSRCESTDDVRQYFAQYGNRKYSFWDDPVGDDSLSLRNASLRQSDHCNRT